MKVKQNNYYLICLGIGSLLNNYINQKRQQIQIRCLFMYPNSYIYFTKNVVVRLIFTAIY